jgi:hypothetical protein
MHLVSESNSAWQCSGALGPAPPPYHGVTQLWCHGIKLRMLESSGCDVSE